MTHLQTVPTLSDALESTAAALADSDLTTLGGVVDAEAFIDALEHAAALAAEAEYMSDATGQVARTSNAPVYPPLVALLARAITPAAA